MKLTHGYLFSFYGAALIILSVSMIWMLFGSVNEINLRDSTQMKLVAEIFILLLTSVALLSKSRNYIFGTRALIVLLLLVTSVLADIFIELRNGEAENQIIVFIGLGIMMILNLWVLIILLKTRPV